MAIGPGKMAAATAVTLAFVVVEIVAGIRSHSLALLSDAGHNVADASALALSWYAIVVARRRATAAMTFGYHRVGVLAAFANAASLVAIAGLIFWEAYERLRRPGDVDAAIMIAVAAVAIVMNVAIALSLRSGSDDLNVRSAYVHMAGDALAAAGVVAGGALVWKTHSPRVDPLVSIAIGGLIVWSSWDILRESVNVLMEGTPADLDLEAVEAALRQLPGVADVHHLHAWTISSGFVACSCHIVPRSASMNAAQRVLADAQRLLAARFDVRHATIQMETACPPGSENCSDPRAEESGAAPQGDADGHPHE